MFHNLAAGDQYGLVFDHPVRALRDRLPRTNPQTTHQHRLRVSGCRPDVPWAGDPGNI